MHSKNRLRKKFVLIRKKNFFEINPNYFNPLIKLLKKKYNKKNINLANYYPSFYEVNSLKLLEIDFFKRFKMLFPVIKKNNTMLFYKWKNYDVLQINKFGMLEPSLLKNSKTPDVMLVPLLAYDNQKNRLGYGKGYYDKFLNKYLKKNNKIVTIGVAFSFQKYHKIPVSDNDVKLNYILTEKGMEG